MVPYLCQMLAFFFVCFPRSLCTFVTLPCLLLSYSLFVVRNFLSHAYSCHTNIPAIDSYDSFVCTNIPAIESYDSFVGSSPLSVILILRCLACLPLGPRKLCALGWLWALMLTRFPVTVNRLWAVLQRAILHDFLEPFISKLGLLCTSCCFPSSHCQRLQLAACCSRAQTSLLFVLVRVLPNSFIY